MSAALADDSRGNGQHPHRRPITLPLVNRGIVVAAALSAVFFTAACGSAGTIQDHPEGSGGVPPVGFGSHSPTPSVAETSGARAAGLGVPVTDGDLEFAVHGLRRAAVAQSPTNPMAQTQAAGEYIIVALSVKNVGSEPKQYFTDSQSLVIDGRQHSADILAAVYLDPESADYIQPGLAIDVETPFDVPVGSTPESIVLSDIAQPRGVTVDLTGAPIATS
jgi:archaellum component FlaG (FlaF/FlaG flagellin family)